MSSSTNWSSSLLLEGPGESIIPVSRKTWKDASKTRSSERAFREAELLNLMDNARAGGCSEVRSRSIGDGEIPADSPTIPRFPGEDGRKIGASRANGGLEGFGRSPVLVGGTDICPP